MTARTDLKLRSDALQDVERPWVDRLRDAGIVAVRDELVARGISPSSAAGIALWLSDQAQRRRLASETTVRGYRATLRELGCPSHGPGGSVDTFRVSAIRLLRAA